MVEISPLPEAPGDPGGGGGDPGSTPPSASPDWARIADFAAGVTGYKDTNFSFLDTGTLVDLAGTYTILSVSGDEIVLSNPALVNASWDNIGDPGDATAYASPYLSTNGERWIGPFVCDLVDLDRMLNNFVALQGLYQIDKKGKQTPMNVSILVELTPVDPLTSDPIGPAEDFFITLVGDDSERVFIGDSLWATPSFVGPCKIRARRTSATNLNKDYTVVDEVKWRDAYGMAAVDLEHFGNVTTAHVRTYATNSALSVKDRQFSIQATRLLPQRIAGSDFTAELYPTDSADDIMAALCLDPFIGRRQTSEVDFDSIYDTIAEVKAYFGDERAGQFGYTFDDRGASFEETIQTVAHAVFCEGFRQGRVIRLVFERATENSALIFNARNVLPDSMTLSYRFGVLDDNDGIELGYTDPKDGGKLTYYIPADRSAGAARTIDGIGIRSIPLAYWQGWRAWNKLRYQNGALQFDATAEAELVLKSDRILVADRTRPDVLQGEIADQVGVTLTLSLPAQLDLERDWVIFLQHTDGSVESIPIEQGASDQQVVLARMPRAPLALDPELYARCTYMIVPVDDVVPRAFVVVEREPQGNAAHTIKATNYSFLYYQHDELILWLAFDDDNFFDSGPYQRDGTGMGGAATIANDQRGVSFDGAAGRSVTFPAFDAPASYTKAAWIRRGDLASAGSILSGPHEAFGFAAGPNIQAGHDGTQVEAAWPDAENWHWATVAYDAEAATLDLYIDGELFDSAEDVPARAIGQLVAFADLVGLADDLRLWKRALTGREIGEVYRAGQISGIAALLTEGRQTLIGEDGQTLILG